ncbi:MULTISPECIES: hypothetical protein [unclassified Flagellimonas]|uniref:hypothetical protein n=1 Tax=Flagellimonas TaxID=444459 RepID=UPI003BACFE8F
MGIDNSPTRLGIYSEQTKFISFYRFGLQKSAHIGYGTDNNGGLYLGTEDNQYTIWVQQNGSVGIGTYNPNPDFRLSVNGKIRAKEIKVETGWADYVFKEGYDLPTLEEVEQHIKEKGHLINIPSAKEVEENGIHLGEMNMRLLEKIEELTLYTLQQQKEINKYQKDMVLLNKKLEAMEQSINNLKE